MTEQFELRFQDLLRHGDWEVKHTKDPAFPYIQHKTGKFFVLPRRVVPDEMSTQLTIALSRSERKQLSKFTREVIRLNVLRSAFPL